MKRALLIIDIQNDFCPGGALQVTEGDRIIPVVNSISSRFETVVAVQDWHPLGHQAFAKTHNRKPYEVIKVNDIRQMLWPVHCVPGTFGAALHPDLILDDVDMILRTGTDPSIDSYSAFLEADRRTETGLRYYLKGLRTEEVYVCGLAADYNVYFSAVDAAEHGTGEGIRAILERQLASPVRWTSTVQALTAAGARLIIECGPGSHRAGA
jgi:nicotinamidase/pyrazinamidase